MMFLHRPRLRHLLRFPWQMVIPVLMGCAALNKHLLAQESTATKQVAKPPMTWKDVAGFKSIPNGGGTKLSNDGKWFMYALMPPDGDADLVIQKTNDTTKYTYSIGSTTAPVMVFSDDGKWCAFKVFPKDKEKKAAAKSGGSSPVAKLLSEKVFLVELAKNKKTEFERVRSFAFNGERSTHLALHITSVNSSGGVSGSGSGSSSGASTSDTPKGSDALLYELATGKTQNVGNVSEMAFNKSGAWLGLTIDAAEKAGNGVLLRNMVSSSMLVMENDKARYHSLNWTEKGDGLALLKSTKDEKYKNERGAVLGIRGLEGAPKLVMYDPKTDSMNFPQTMTISPNRAPLWTEDLTRLLFGIHALELAKKDDKKDAKTADKQNPSNADMERLARLKADTTIKTLDDLAKALAKARDADSKKGDSAKVKSDDADKSEKPEKPEKPDLTVWHWQDKRLQSQQQVTEKQDKDFSFLAMVDASTKKFIRLADSTIRTITPAPKHLYGISQNNQPYQRQSTLDGQNYADVYTVDLKTGARFLALEKYYLPNTNAAPKAAPDGTKFFYWSDGHWYSYDIGTKTKRNITEQVPTSFVDVDDDHNVRKPPQDFIGWSSDSKYGLLSDGWDVWLVAADGKAKAQNLSLTNGKTARSEGIRYQRRFKLDPEEKGIDLRNEQYFRIYGERTKKGGIARLDAGQAMKRILWDDAYFSDMEKAKNAAVFVFSKETFTSPTTYFWSGSEGLTGAKQISTNAPEFSKYAWSAGVQLVNYQSDKGDTLQGALFLPAGYEQGKKYPTIVYYYEKLSQTLHYFSRPGFSGTGWNPGVYTSNGYAVFIPDIVYKLNDPGMSAVWCVLPGVKAALQTGIVDEARVGIQGHSWGGYQTCFLVTQTPIFKAAAAGAPLTDMVSMYNLIYKNVGITNGQIFEASQGRLVAPWENWEAYYRNSPLHNITKVTTPLLMLHNDADGAVDFTQGVEFFVALRRLNKPVVMMQYKGENHGLAKLANRKDYATRMMEFFDTHLKGKPAPDWLQSGLERLQIEEHLDTRAFSEGGFDEEFNEEDK
jgi:dipeptidyl aminopeptidase/acylaminoacyl peptidase